MAPKEILKVVKKVFNNLDYFDIKVNRD